MTNHHRGTRADWAAYGAALLAAGYAGVSFHWAFGGTAGIGTLGGRLEELGRQGDPAALWLAGVAGVLKLLGVVVALALVRPWGRVVPRWLVSGAAWTGAVVLVAYGGLNVVVGGLVLGGVIDAPEAADRGALWWHVLVWDLWFLVWGVLLGLAARRYGRVRAAGDLQGRGLRGGG